MDCEKYEPLLLDELYEELDELTSAAVKRHVSGCARCNGILQGMRATRRAAVLPMVEPPAELEDRILAAAREAQKVVPLRGRVSTFLSRAGSWAMRPQTAMAAVFLLMIGSSAFLLRSNKRTSQSAMSVVVAGEPSPRAAEEPSQDTLSGPAASAAHGAGSPSPTTFPPVAAPTSEAALAQRAGEKDAKKAKAEDPLGVMGNSAFADDEGREVAKSRAAGPTNAGVPAGAPPPMAYAPADQPAALGAQDPFSAGMAAYRARSFAEATKQFDAAAANGDMNAALWAANSTRDGSGCGVALGRFDSVAQRAQGTYQGAQAQLEAARCEIALGQLDAARDRLNKLKGVSSHAAMAQKELEQVEQVAARRAAAGKAGAAGGGAAAPAKAAAAPRPAPAAPLPAAKPAATATQGL